MRLPKDADKSERSHFLILKRYIKSGWFFFDVIATFPFYLIEPYILKNETASFGVLLKLLRMIRLPKVLNLLDITRFKKLIEAASSGQTRGKRVTYQLVMKNVLKMFRLVVLTIIMTYFTGCVFYFISVLDDDQEQTFRKSCGLDTDDFNNFYKLITVSYFTLTTLATVGYGDIYARTNNEKLCAVVMMLGGVGYFSFVMSSFVDLIRTFTAGNLNVSDEETFDMHNWLTLLARFRENKPLPNNLYRQINQHFKYYWTNNRLT
jgi:hypothetical protein